MMGSDPESWIREEFPDVVTDPAIIWRELFRSSLDAGVNSERADVSMDVCHWLGTSRRSHVAGPGLGVRRCRSSVRFLILVAFSGP